MTKTSTAWKLISDRRKLNIPFRTKIYLLKVPLDVNIVQQDLFQRKQLLKI